MKPYGAFKDGVIIGTWKEKPDAHDLEGLDYTCIRQLMPNELVILSVDNLGKLVGNPIDWLTAMMDISGIEYDRQDMKQWRDYCQKVI